MQVTKKGPETNKELYVRPDLDVIADRDRRHVQGHEAEVNEGPSADLDLVAVIAVKRRPDLGVLRRLLREAP
jgi:hypothetical protein